MKAFTSIEQSKVLAKILPIDSADMAYIPSAEDDEGNTLYTAEYKSEIVIDEDDKDIINCWSLAALLEIMPHEIKIWDIIYYIKIHPKNNNWFMSYKNNNEEFVGTYSTFLIDACVEMIIKLKEKGLI